MKLGRMPSCASLSAIPIAAILREHVVGRAGGGTAAHDFEQQRLQLAAGDSRRELLEAVLAERVYDPIARHAPTLLHGRGFVE